MTLLPRADVVGGADGREPLASPTTIMHGHAQLRAAIAAAAASERPCLGCGRTPAIRCCQYGAAR